MRNCIKSAQLVSRSDLVQGIYVRFGTACEQISDVDKHNYHRCVQPL